VLYKTVGYAGVFAVAFAVLTVDFLMRLIMIEKKVAKRYEPEETDPDPSPSPNNPSNGHLDGTAESHPNDERDDERQPLLPNKPSTPSSNDNDEAYRIPANQPAIARSIPILPCLSDPRLLASLLIAFVQAMLLGNFDATIPTVSQQYFSFDSLKAGILFLPLGLSDFLLGPIFGWAVDRFGTKVISVFAYTFLPPVLILLRLPHPGGKDQIILYAGLLALCGVGLAGTNAPSVVEAGAIMQRYYEVNPEWFGPGGPYAQLYGLNSMVFAAGLTIGPELAGELKQKVGYGNMNLVLAGITAVTAVMCFVFIGGRPRWWVGRRKE
jgi:hypothetical protein